MKKLKLIAAERHIGHKGLLNFGHAYQYLLLLVVLSSSCGLRKSIPEGRQLLTANQIVGANSFGSGELQEQILLRPNRKVLGLFRFHLRTYAAGQNRHQRVLNRRYRHGDMALDTSRLNRFLMETAGEAPIFADSSAVERSAGNLRNYLFNKGHFQAQVNYEIQTKNKKKNKAVAIYKIDAGPSYTIGRKEKFANDFVLDSILQSTRFEELEVGDALDFDQLAKERNRLNEMLRDYGFFRFNKNYINYDVDTSAGPKQVKVNLIVNSYLQTEPHQQYRLRSVNVIIEGEQSSNYFKQDTVDGVVITDRGLRIKNYVLMSNMSLRPGQFFSQSKVDEAYRKLIALDLFKFVNINYPKINDSSGYMDVVVQLMPSARHDFIWEPQLVSSEQSLGLEEDRSRNYGFVNNLTLRNKNISGRADQFNINSKTSFETQLRVDSVDAVVNVLQNFTASYVIPQLLFFENLSARKNWVQSRTSFNASYYLERNLNFNRTVLPLNVSYQFSKRRTTFLVAPWQLSFNQASVSPTFTGQLNNSDSIFISRLFANNLISGSRFSFLYTDRPTNPRSYWWIQSHLLELSGNSISAYHRLSEGVPARDKSLLGVRYFQFVRSEFDIRYTRVWNEVHSMVARLWTGIGIPYGNSELLPFERRFFVGGSNSLRAWRPRTVGPGLYSDDARVRIDKSGELLLQANWEYRFDIFLKYLEGALFVDAGNIWNVSEDSTFFNDNFHFRDFYKQLAINTGIGLRWDFDFFILRFDWGIPLHDPTFPENKRWIIREFGQDRWISRQTILNIAVGYPF